MEERKRRITRKYLRERMLITYSDMVVPEASVTEDEGVLVSEKFQQSQEDLQRQGPGAAKPPPQQRPAPRPKNRNWLLTESTELDDPYADPFVLEKSKNTTAEKDEWSMFGKERETSFYMGTERKSRFNFQGSGLSSGQQSGSSQGPFNSSTPTISPVNDGRSAYQQQEGLMPNLNNVLDLSPDKATDSALNPISLQSPFSRQTQSSSDRSFGSKEQQNTGGYSPYKSSYQKQYDQQGEQRGHYGNPNQEYQRPDTFQQWKNRSPIRLDPMRDDAFINEMMPKPH